MNRLLQLDVHDTFSIATSLIKAPAPLAADLHTCQCVVYITMVTTLDFTFT